MNLFNIPTTFISHSIIIFCGSRGVKYKQSNVFSLVFEIAKKKKKKKKEIWEIKKQKKKKKLKIKKKKIDTWRLNFKRKIRAPKECLFLK